MQQIFVIETKLCKIKIEFFEINNLTNANYNTKKIYKDTTKIFFLIYNKKFNIWFWSKLLCVGYVIFLCIK